MAKLNLNDTGSLQSENAAISVINANNNRIEVALENTLSRDGTAPNYMDADLDMNSNRLLNLSPAASDTEPVRRKEWLEAIDGMATATYSSILDNTVSNAKLTDVPANTIKGRTSGSGDPQDLTGDEAGTVVSSKLNDPDAVSITLANMYTRHVDTRMFGITPITGSPGNDGTGSPSEAGWLDNECSSKVNAMFAYCKNNGINEIKWDSGAYYFGAEPDPITWPCKLTGSGKAATTLYKDYVSSSPVRPLLFWYPTTANSADGGGCFDMSIIAFASDRNEAGRGSAVGAIRDPNNAIGRLSFERLYLTKDISATKGQWHFTMYFDGSDVVSGPPAIRQMYVSDCHIFGGKFGAAAFLGCSLQIANSVFVLAGGDSGGVNFGGNLTIGCDEMKVIGVGIAGDVNLDFVTKGNLQLTLVGGDLTIGPTCSDTVVFVSHCTGTITNNGTNCFVYHIKDGKVYGSPTYQNGMNVASGQIYKVNGDGVVGSRKTGWGLPTGTATRSAFDTGVVTTEQLAERVKALIDDFHSNAGHGLITT